MADLIEEFVEFINTDTSLNDGCTLELQVVATALEENHQAIFKVTRHAR